MAHEWAMLVKPHVCHGPEEHDVGLRAVNSVVHPAPRLLHTQASPLGLQSIS